MLPEITGIPFHVVKENYEKIAIVDYVSGKAKRYTYTELDNQINLLASGISKKHFLLGTRIAIIAYNSFNYITTYFAIRRAGLVPVLINYKLPADQISKIIEHSDTNFIFYDDEFKDKIPNVPSLSFSDISTVVSSDEYHRPNYDPERPAFFLYTSGSTGEPKGVVVSTKSRRWLIESQYNVRKKRSKILISTPMYHMNGLSNIEKHINNQTLIVIIPSFSASQYIRLIPKHEINQLSLVPPMMAMILNHPKLNDSVNFDSVKSITLASAPTSQQLFEQTKSRFKNARIYLRYGLTEMGAGMFGPPPKDLNLIEPPMTVGYPLKNVEYKLIDSVLYIKSPSMLKTYHKNEKLHASSLTEDGFFNTKDKFRIDENGFYFFIGRADDMFVSGGENIFPSEVENIIEKHPEIAQAAVLGLPDEIKGVKPYAFVVRVKDSKVTEKDVQEFVLKNAATYQYPRRVWFLDQMPLTGSNKIDKLELEKIATYNMGV